MDKRPFKKDLTNRELEVLKHFAEGKTHQQIADLLYISVDTVRTHKKKINRKIELKEMYGLLYTVLFDRKHNKFPKIGRQ